MVQRQKFINKIRSLNYYFIGKQKRTELWRKRGGTHFISVPLSDLLRDDWVANSLRQAGCAREEIQSFLASAKS
jgi:hypothetical protein